MKSLIGSIGQSRKIYSNFMDKFEQKMLKISNIIF